MVSDTPMSAQFQLLPGGARLSCLVECPALRGQRSRHPQRHCRIQARIAARRTSDSIHNGHKILAGARTIGPHIYEIRRDDDFRKGERFFYFDAPNYIHHYFDPTFADVRVGRIQDQLFTETLDWWLVAACKPR